MEDPVGHQQRSAARRYLRLGPEIERRSIDAPFRPSHGDSRTAFSYLVPVVARDKAWETQDLPNATVSRGMYQI